MTPVLPRSRLRKLAIAGTLLALALAVFYSIREAREWKDRFTPPPAEFDGFVQELREVIPEDARVIVVCIDGPVLGAKHAFLLSARLHPRVVVFKGPADWIIEIPCGEFSRAQSSWGKAAP